MIEGSVGPMPVVVVPVLGEDGFEMAAAQDEEPVQALPADGADSETAFARGALTGVLTIRIHSAAKTASKEEVNFASRSRIRKLAGVVRSVRS